MNWWSRNAPSIEAIAACVTALVALSALIGVKIQIEATEELQRVQSARDAYRAHLSLAVTSPAFAQPSDGCALLQSSNSGAYQAYVDHLLYSAEQMLVVSEGWESTFLNDLKPHEDYLCSALSPSGATLETEVLLEQFQLDVCPAQPAC